MADNVILSQIPISELFNLIKQAVKDELDTRDILKSSTRNNEKPITQKELCSYLGVTQQTVIRWKKKKKIPFFTIGTAIRFDLQDVLKSLGK